jgi:hypothetical protein
VRELGRVLADQYLRVDLSKLGVKTVTRSALDRALGEIKLSQAGLTDAINGGLGNKFKAADVIVTGSLSQIGDNYTASVEAIDVSTGSSLVSSRSTFPKTASAQALWANILGVSGTMKPPPGSQASSSEFTLPAEPLSTESGRYYGEQIRFYGCHGNKSDEIVTCVFTLVSNTDNTLDLSPFVSGKEFYFVDSFGQTYTATSAQWIVRGSNPKTNLAFYAGIPMRFDVKIPFPKEMQTATIMQILHRWRDVGIEGR